MELIAILAKVTIPIHGHLAGKVARSRGFNTYDQKDLHVMAFTRCPLRRHLHKSFRMGIDSYAFLELSTENECIMEI